MVGHPDCWYKSCRVEGRRHLQRSPESFACDGFVDAFASGMNPTAPAWQNRGRIRNQVTIVRDDSQQS